MASMRKVAFLALLGFAAACLAQNQPDAVAPPEVDRALRERAARFFQAHVDGKYRLAEQLVAEDTKDYYYASEKPRYLKFEITKITYSDNFTKATVSAKCERVMNTQFGPVNINFVQESLWKIENGEWCWYTDPTVIRTPFGVMKRADPSAAGPAPEAAPSALVRKGPSVDDVLNQMSKSVRVDKTLVRLSPKAATGAVVVTNTMPGAVSLKLSVPETPGLTVKLEKEQVAPRRSTRVLFSYTPSATVPAPVKVDLKIGLTGQIIPIRVEFEN